MSNKMMKKNKKVGIIVIVVVAILFVVTSVVMVVVGNSVLSVMADLRVERNQATLVDYGLVGEAFQVESRDGLMINAYIAPCEDARGLQREELPIWDPSRI